MKKHLSLFVQYLFGMGLLIFGANGFFKFLPLPEKEGFAQTFIQVLHDTHYMMPTIASIQIFCGITLLLNRYKTLGLILLAPISFNILAFHLFFDRAALIPAVGFFSLNLFFLINCLKKHKVLAYE